MSDYKVVQTDIQMVDQNIVMQVLELMFGSCEQNTTVTNKWHTTRADIAIRKAQLPPHLQEYGDLGLVKRNGKLEFIACSDEDSHYIDGANRLKAMRAGKSPAEAAKAYPDGQFVRDQKVYLNKIANGYGCIELAMKIRQKCPSAKFKKPQGKLVGSQVDDRAWTMPGSVDSADLARLGIRV